MRTIIHTNQAPAAVGPYSQGICAGELIFTAGQIPLNPATGQRELFTQPSTTFDAKDRSGKLEVTEAPDLTSIFNKIKGNDNVKLEAV